MQSYQVKLQSKPSNSFKCQLAAQSLDIDVNKKLTHELNINCDIQKHFNVGLILGASGSGKTTLAKQIYGNEVFNINLDSSKTILDQFPNEMKYDDCANILTGIGLTSVPCWIRPVHTLSNGQRARAEAALSMIKNELTVLDEWTSVVDRTVAKVMSHCVQKHARKVNKQIVLLSCHYDVIEWLNPDWIIDCNTQSFVDRGSLRQDERIRKEQLNFVIKEVDRSTWKSFSKYHYLSDRLPGGKIYTFGVFHEDNQIGFQCFANYVPTRKNMTPIFHSNRTVIHPDYAGFGLGIRVINESSKYMKEKYKYKIMAKFSSTPVYKAMIKQSQWKLVDVKTQIGKTNVGGNMMRKDGFRENIKTYSFEYRG